MERVPAFPVSFCNADLFLERSAVAEFHQKSALKKEIGALRPGRGADQTSAGCPPRRRNPFNFGHAANAAAVPATSMPALPEAAAESEADQDC